jgi:ribosomal protein L9
MQIILKEDIQNVGFKDDLVEVKKRIWSKFFNTTGKSNFSYDFC